MTYRHFNWATWSSKINNRRILATKTITSGNCWWSKNRFCMKSKRQKSAIKKFCGSIFHSQTSTGNFARKQPPTDMSRHLGVKLIKLLKKICIFMCEITKTKNWWLQNFNCFCKSVTQIFVLVRTGPTTSTAGPTTAAVTEKVWGEYVLVRVTAKYEGERNIG